MADRHALLTAFLPVRTGGRHNGAVSAQEVDQYLEKVNGKTIAGFAAFKNHLSYLPHSGSVFSQLADELKGYTTSTGALRFDIDRALPAPLVEKLVEVRLRQAFPD